MLPLLTNQGGTEMRQAGEVQAQTRLACRNNQKIFLFGITSATNVSKLIVISIISNINPIPKVFFWKRGDLVNDSHGFVNYRSNRWCDQLSNQGSVLIDKSSSSDLPVLTKHGSVLQTMNDC